MKKIYTLASVLLMAVAAFIFLGEKSNKNTNDPFSSSSGSVYSSAGRAEWETMRLSDPATGRIPAGMRSKELAFSESLPQYYPSAVARVGANYISRGPVNVGGRTRAIAVDVTNENIMFAGSVNGGLWRSTDAGVSWTRVSSINENPAITSIAQDRRPGRTNNWYYSTGEAIGASASGSGAYYLGNGVYKSTDGGVTWALLTFTSTGSPQTFDSSFDITFKIVTDPSDTVNSVVYLACYGTIYKSNNGGTTWGNDLGSTTSYSYFSDIDVTTTGVAYACLDSSGGQKGIWRKAPPLGWFSISPPGWDTGSFARVVIGINPSNENEVYFLGETPNMGKMTTNWKGEQEWNSLWKYTYISGNGTGAGGAWTDLSANIPFDGSQLGNFNSQGGYDLLVAVHPADPNTVFIGGTNLFRSSDGFTSPNNTSFIGGYDSASTIPFYTTYPNHHPDQHGIVFLPSDPDKVFQSNDGGLNFTTNIRATPVVWQELNNGYTTSQFYTVALDHATPGNEIIIGGLQDNGTWFTNTSDPLVPWTQPGLGDGSHCAIDNGHQNYYMSRQEGRVAKYSLDASGNIIGFRRIDPIGGSDYMFINPFILDPNNTNTMYLGGGKKIWRNDSLNMIPLTGEWDTISTGWYPLPDSITTAGTKISCMAMSVLPANTLFVGTSKRSIYKIENANTATPVMTDISSNAFNANSYVSCVAVDPTDANKIIAAFSNYNIYSLYYTIDGGVVWNKIGGNLEANSTGTGNGPSIRWVTIAPTASGTVYFAGTSIGLFATNNLDGLNTVWNHLAPNDIGNVVVDMMAYRISDGTLAIGTHGAGLFSAMISDTLFTEIKESAVTKHSFHVYPNPVASEFLVSYDLLKSQAVKLSLYNMEGKRVRTIDQGAHQPGRQELRIQRGGLAEGVYFLKLESGSQVIGVKKMIFASDLR
ncbi:MAG: T9SS type A sorting domain-containing protein [Bacteroidia bacterium]|nr:T9SS type A sorting domain-containing protein [Bacteroidia bacterium]